MRRSSLWGIFGGALTAYLLGPRFEKETTEEGILYRDNPIIPVCPSAWYIEESREDW
jgi:hypothetical protein